MVMIFGFVASVLNMYDPKAAGFAILFLMFLSTSLSAYYFTYKRGHLRGYLQGREELLDKLSEIFELIKESEAVAFGISDAFGDIKSFEIIEKLEAEG